MGSAEAKNLKTRTVGLQQLNLKGNPFVYETSQYFKLRQTVILSSNFSVSHKSGQIIVTSRYLTPKG